MRRLRKSLSILGSAALLCVAAGGSVSAQIVDDAYPIDPPDGESVGPRPNFRIGFDGEEIENVRFRLVLSQDDFETETYVFDQSESMSGWALNIYDDEAGMVFRPPRPLEDGDYVWRVDAYNGVDWVEGESVHALRIDGTVPADVERVQLDFDAKGRLRLRWMPVSYDESGRPEYVRRYRVYRTTRKGLFVMMRASQVGEAETTEFVEREVPPESGLVFYRVMAEDEAGNHRTGRWEPTFPPLPEDEQAANDASMQNLLDRMERLGKRKEENAAAREKMLEDLKRRSDDEDR